MYDDLKDLNLLVPCSTWDKEEAVKCWGEDFASKSVKGVIKKVSVNRRTKQPCFEIEFPEKKYQKSFVGFDLDYIMRYSEEVPLRYHKMKADHIMEAAKKAEQAMLSEAACTDVHSETESENGLGARKSLNASITNNNMDSKLSPEEAKMQPADNSKETDSSKKVKKRTNASTPKGEKKKKKEISEDYLIDGGDSAEDTDDDTDADEDESLLVDDADEDESTGSTQLVGSS